MGTSIYEARIRLRSQSCLRLVCCGGHPSSILPRLYQPEIRIPWLQILISWTPKVCRIITLFGFWAIILPTFGGLGSFQDPYFLRPPQSLRDAALCALAYALLPRDSAVLALGVWFASVHILHACRLMRHIPCALMTLTLQWILQVTTHFRRDMMMRITVAVISHCFVDLLLQGFHHLC